MAIVKTKPTSAGRRHVVKIVGEELYKGRAYAPLLEKQSKSGGRNNQGRITTRHVGGGRRRRRPGQPGRLRQGPGYRLRTAQIRGEAGMNQERVFKVLLGPHVTEKAAMAAERNQYVFKVASDATKPEIKAAVQELFGKKVDRVSVLNVKGKTKRTAHGVGMRKGYRKAYVTLAAGETLEDFSGAE